jgi:hypothetical protein
MFNYWKKVDGLNHLNRLLLVVIVSQMVIILGLIITLSTMPKRYEFWLTPSMAANGGLLKEGEVSHEYVQGFVATLLPSLNTWSKSGSREFSKNLNAYRYYFTPRHQQLMEKTLAAYKDTQLFNRMQVASLYQFMSAGDVQPIGHNAWEVHVLMRITQRLKDASQMVIADKVVDYHLRVVKVTLSRLQNPFQLALDGYTAPEHLVQDLLATPLLKEEKHETI